ncbi:hypothetical protein G5C51_13760 [Streptomyces sp. A7024]|uniref:S-adenosyl-L-homocysteine hydrolase NAD binding domain-containing protein n=1 Tax=Streptomyces coryli TaxID=1128680 RepID=A0A6G4TY79_9ACTN|nr:hypothetical protein [Streptomyces coryli]NGN64959.1 hypothetical protein [Streptomyces coryli]
MSTHVDVRCAPEDAAGLLRAAAARIERAAGFAQPPAAAPEGLRLRLPGGLPALLSVTAELRAERRAPDAYRLALQTAPPAEPADPMLQRVALALHQQPFTDAESAQIRDELPLMNEVTLPLRGTRPLAGTAPIVTGHFLNDLVHLVDCLIEAGARPDAITVLRKDYAYRLRHRVEGHLLAQGIRVEPVDRAATAVAEHGLRAAAAGLRPLALDDGGYVLPALLDNHRDQLANWAGVVEQTMSGIYKLERFGSDLPVPLFSVAQSRLKGTLESYWIADNVVEAALSMLPPMILEGHPVLVIGYGQVGTQIARRLRARQLNVAVYDIDVVRLIAAHQEGFFTANTLDTILWDHEPLLIFGTTGRGCMSTGSYQRLARDCYLASCTSRDVEFDLPALRKLAVDVRRQPADGTLSCTLPQGVTAHVLAEGRPVNFHERDSITNQRADLVFAGMLLGAATLAAGDPRFGPGIRRAAADMVLEDARILDRHYELHGPRAQSGAPADDTATRRAMAAQMRQEWSAARNPG